MYQRTGKVDWSALCQQMSDAMTTDCVAAMPCITFAITLKVWERAGMLDTITTTSGPAVMLQHVPMPSQNFTTITLQSQEQTPITTWEVSCKCRPTAKV